jgi:hypothetical protein
MNLHVVVELAVDFRHVVAPMQRAPPRCGPGESATVEGSSINSVSVAPVERASSSSRSRPAINGLPGAGRKRGPRFRCHEEARAKRRLA